MQEKSLDHKISELFALRKIPELLEVVGIKQEDQFVQKLQMLQASIYQLDHYLESNWDLETSKLNEFWEDIYSVLNDLGYSGKKAEVLCKDIRKYQDFECSLRKSEPKIRKKLFTTYRIKSCDVALIRKLIYDNKKNEPNIKQSDWRFYDLVTEVNDDIQDLMEDCQNYNGNRFLLSLLFHKKRKTKKIYRKFLKKIQKKADKRFKKQTDHPVKKWLDEQFKETMSLLNSQLKDLDKSLINNSKLANKFN